MKNCRREEERFTQEYFDRLRALSKLRARRWTAARHRWEVHHVEAAEWLYWSALVLPFVIAVWRYVEWMR